MRILCEHESLSVEFIKQKYQKQNNWKKMNQMRKNYQIVLKYRNIYTYIYIIPNKKKKRNQRNIWFTNEWEVSKIVSNTKSKKFIHRIVDSIGSIYF